MQGMKARLNPYKVGSKQHMEICTGAELTIRKLDVSMNQKTEKPSGSDYDGLVRFVSWTPFIAGAVLLVLVMAYIFAFYQNGWAKDQVTWGQFGDYIGGLLNPLVAGFALLALVASVRLQKAELAATREELKESRQAMQEQAKIAEQQRSEQRFFDCMGFYQKMVDGQKAIKNNTLYYGKEAILVNYQEIMNGFAINYLHDRMEDSNDSREIFVIIKNSENFIFEEKLINGVKNYSRTVLSLIETICDSLQSKNHNYIKIFINQLTEDELCYIMIYFLFEIESNKYFDIASSVNLFGSLANETIIALASQYLDSFSEETSCVN